MIPIHPHKLKTSTLSADNTSPALAANAYLKPGALHLRALPPLTLYVHFPWCVRKCPYCDFNSHEHASGIENIPEASYLDALRLDLEQALPLVWGRRIHAVFIGGGTPSLLSAAGLDRLLGDLRALLPIEVDAEITLEANPGTFEAIKFASYRTSGINRLSIGIQSFNAEHLKALGRIHDVAQARQAVEIAQKHFDNFNLDLMYALPGQSIEQLQQDVNTALAFQPPHLSLYHLTLEPNTVFAKYPPPLPDDDLAAGMQEWIETRTTEQGYDHYEISAYAAKDCTGNGRRSRHNLNYWHFGDYLGIGAGAHSKLSFPHRIVRQARYKQPKTYMEHALGQSAGGPIQEEFEVGRQDLPFEFMLNLLRLTEGFESRLFGERTGLTLNVIEPVLQRAQDSGLIEQDHLRIRPTLLGMRFLNDLQEMFLPETS